MLDHLFPMDKLNKCFETTPSRSGCAECKAQDDRMKDPRNALADFCRTSAACQFQFITKVRVKGNRFGCMPRYMAAKESDCSACNPGFFLTEKSGCQAYKCEEGPKGACKACQGPSNRTAHNQCQECNFGYELTESLKCKAGGV